MKIAMIGAPGVGKTTVMEGLSYFLKRLGRHVVLVPELAKMKVYEGANFSQLGFDVANTLDQKKVEAVMDAAKARGEIETIITDGPLCNGWIYASFYNKELEAPVLREIARMAVGSYDRFILVEPASESPQFSTFGRNEDRETSLAIAAHIERQITPLGIADRVTRVNMFTPMRTLMSLAGVEAADIDRILSTFG